MPGRVEISNWWPQGLSFREGLSAEIGIPWQCPAGRFHQHGAQRQSKLRYFQPIREVCVVPESEPPTNYVTKEP